MTTKIIKRFLPTLTMLLFNQRGNTTLMGGDGGGSGADDGNDGGVSGGIGGDSGGGDGSGAGGDNGSDDIMYPDGLDEELRGNPTLLKFYDKEAKNFKVPNIMKALVHANRMVGADKIQKPQSSWTEEQWKDFHLASGLPENIDAYKLNIEKGDDHTINQFKETAYGAGVRPEQAEKLWGFFDSVQQQRAEQSKIQAEEYFSKGKAELEAQYGTKLDGALQRGDHALSTIMSGDEIAKIQESGLSNDPMFAKLLIKVADMFGEENAFNDEATAAYGMSPEEAAVELEKMSKADHPFQTTRDPKTRAMYRDKWMKLAKIKGAGRKTGRIGGNSAMM